uniref:CSON009459 protein n=1 Tax=Culicoides sonorensis TaxID=179676 RepID=A0A336KEN5_CULSO
MAEKPEELETPEDKLQRAKELYGRGSRNYYVKAYSEAADDLSQACAIFADIHGPTADECGMPYLLYAKSMIAVGQEENKVLDVPDEEDEDEEEGEGEVENPEEESEDTASKGTESATEEVIQVNGSAPATEPTPTTEPVAKTNGTAAPIVDAKPGTSSGVVNGEAEDEEEAGEANNLEVAWEVLELAAVIFARQGESAYENLAEALTELAGISFENSHFDIAIKDYSKALEVHNRMEKTNRRHVAEIYFQIGLSHLMLNDFDESIEAFKKAGEILDAEIDFLKLKEQTDELAADIKDLEETRGEIVLKIIEVEETKQVSIEEVKRELEKLMNHEPEKENVPGPSSSGASSSAEKPKATDISHLIKRKKPDAPAGTEVEESPAKKQATGE